MNSSHVPTQCPPTGETGIADFALMRLGTTVGVHVVLEMLVGGKSLFANGADVWPEMLGSVDRVHMSIEF